MQRGFTLIETVVTVGIVAAMAAVVIPQVAAQFDMADPTRIQKDLKNLQVGVETYNVNVKAMPGDLDDLANQPTATDDSALTIATTWTAFTANEVGLWQGPYIDVAIPDLLDTDAELTTGYAATIEDSFVCYSSGNNETGVSEGTSGTAAANDAACSSTGTGQKFVAFQITGVVCPAAAITGTSFEKINRLFDGSTEPTPKASGRVRCRVSGATPKTINIDVVYFLAVPIT